MARVVDCYKIYEVNYDLLDNQPFVGSTVDIDEWDETGTTITHNIDIVEIMDIKTYKSGDKWMLTYIIKGR